MLFTATITAQDAVGFQTTQDVKLALKKDDHGNEPFTADLQLKFVLQGNDSPTGYLQIAGKYEFAQLDSGDYSRFGFEVGYAFHTNILNIYVAPLVGYGYAYRWGSRYTNFEFSAEVKLPITKSFSFICLTNLNQRKEFKTPVWRYNVGVGVRYDINTNWMAKQAKKGTRF